jgi:predicted KAP-like P-loop ATPase
MQSHLKIVANAVLQRLIRRSAAHQVRHDAPQRRAVRLNEGKPAQKAKDKTVQMVKAFRIQGMETHERLTEARKVLPPMDCSG